MESYSNFNSWLSKDWNRLMISLANSITGFLFDKNFYWNLNLNKDATEVSQTGISN